MELNQEEIKIAVQIVGDMDLMQRAREFTKLGQRVPPMEVLALLHQTHVGGIKNFYGENHF